MPPATQRFATLLALMIAAVGSTSALALTTTLTDKGVLVDAGDGGKYTVPFPGIGAGEKFQSPSEVTVTAKSARGKYDNGATFSAELKDDGTLALAFAALPADVKNVKFTMSLPLALKDGGTFAVDAGKTTAFPAEVGKEAFLFKNNGKRLVLTPAKGDAFAVVLDHGWQQVMDLRVWNTHSFAWLAFSDLVRTNGNEARYTLKVGAPATLALPAAAATAPLLLAASKAPPLQEIGDTRVEKWKDGKRAAFLLAFDDSAPSQLKYAMPELQKRGLVGTFYINPGNGPYKNEQKTWEKMAREPGIVLANHTFTHVGAADAAQLDDELAQCNNAINKIFPDRKTPRLIGFGQPGGVPWKVTDQEFKAALDKHHLVNRPSFYGPPFHQKTPAECVAVIDNALARGEMGHLDFHGVGGDWHVTSMEIFTAIVDKLDAEKTRLWSTDVVSWHQYVTERNSAEVKPVAVAAGQLRLALKTKADPALYDLPLTLSTRVDGAWKQCTVTQGKLTAEVGAVDGVITYDATPGGAEIVITPASAK